MKNTCFVFCGRGGGATKFAGLCCCEGLKSSGGWFILFQIILHRSFKILRSCRVRRRALQKKSIPAALQNVRGYVLLGGKLT